MKIRFIQPTQLDETGTAVKYKKLFMPFVTTATLAGLTPDGIDVAITEEHVEDVDFEEDVDLVAVTAQTNQAPRAYQIGDAFRERGKPTILGGIHASMCSDEALEHFDAIVIGEAEDIWETVVADAKAGNLKRVYEASAKPDLARSCVPRFDLLDFRQYVIPPFARTPLIPIQTSRGCPNRCEFCSVAAFLGNRIRRKPVANVMREIEAVRPSRVFFTDDNLTASPSYARELFEALKALRLRWACQMSTQIIKFPDLIDRAAEAGCHETFIGVESLNPRSLEAVDKSFNKVERYAELFARLKKVGILPQVSLMFGLDGDTPESLRRTIDTFMHWDINYVYIHIVTPFPGTVLYDRVKDNGRIFERDWSLYDGTHCVLRPIGLSVQELNEIVWEGYERFYSLKGAVSRAWRFRREYIKYFPRDFAPEEFFFQVCIARAVKHREHPFSLGQRKWVGHAG